jgi:hypothetical protein
MGRVCCRQVITTGWKSPSQANSCSTTQEIPRMLSNAKVHYSVHKYPSLNPKPGIPVHSLPSYFFKIHFKSVGSEVITAVTVVSAIFLVVPPCSWERARHIASIFSLFLAWYILGPEDGGNMFLRNVEFCPNYMALQLISPYSSF